MSDGDHSLRYDMRWVITNYNKKYLKEIGIIDSVEAYIR